MCLILIGFYAGFEYWVPLITAFGLVISAFKSVKRGVGEWADSLLHNHLAHIQTACESTASTLKEMSAFNGRIQTELEVIKVQTARK